MRTLIRYTIVNQDGQPVIRAVRVVYPSTARVAPPAQTASPRPETAVRSERTLEATSEERRAASGS
ncbi:hypothetical protein OO015_11480 [Thermomicrobium sp. 4228-Ro]|uniref:hypothetical protein n=1 Tax=Thermomicrobium sp. 4228-Ro TaxID=2993937 RepID=UPI002248E452|nr:hypothetical protein [Thermomicrobium sp. 4228-Ro]MCX2728111.1 hypothetical protein [Thermomicrobium sp. 4228-Ro]